MRGANAYPTSFSAAHAASRSAAVTVSKRSPAQTADACAPVMPARTPSRRASAENSVTRATRLPRALLSDPLPPLLSDPLPPLLSDPLPPPALGRNPRPARAALAARLPPRPPPPAAARPPPPAAVRSPPPAGGGRVRERGLQHRHRSAARVGRPAQHRLQR